MDPSKTSVKKSLENNTSDMNTESSDDEVCRFQQSSALSKVLDRKNQFDINYLLSQSKEISSMSNEVDSLEKDFQKIEESLEETSAVIETCKNAMAACKAAAPMCISVGELDIQGDGSTTFKPTSRSSLCKALGSMELEDRSNNGKRKGSPLASSKTKEPKLCEEIEIKEISGTPYIPLVNNIPQTKPTVGDKVYAMTLSSKDPWLPAEIIKNVKVGHFKYEYRIKFCQDVSLRSVGQPDLISKLLHYEKQINVKQMAFFPKFPSFLGLPIGSRVLGKFSTTLCPQPNVERLFYAGIVAENPRALNRFRYLIFFDDGMAQYVDQREIRLVVEASREVWRDVYPGAAKFFKKYVEMYPDRHLLKYPVGSICAVEWNGFWWPARIIEIDCSLFKFKFELDNRIEWIYRGSLRLSQLFIQHKQGLPAFTSVFNHISHLAALVKSMDRPEDDSVLINWKPHFESFNLGAYDPVLFKSFRFHYNITWNFDYEPPSCYAYYEYEGKVRRMLPADYDKLEKDSEEHIKHVCSKDCVGQYDETDDKWKSMSPLSVPMHFGWKRKKETSVYYVSPCGIKVSDMNNLWRYLCQTSCSIPIDSFCFDGDIDCFAVFEPNDSYFKIEDITEGRENIPISCINAVDDSYPLYVKYTPTRIPVNVKIPLEEEFLVCCDCVDDCYDKEKCSCWQLTRSGISFTKLSNPNVPTKGYDFKKLSNHLISGVYECNSKCRCSKKCLNRVVQWDIKWPLQIFKTSLKGWGIRTLCDIPEGSFICCYSGLMYDEDAANKEGVKFGDEYLTDLDFIECVAQCKENYESDVTDIEQMSEPKKEVKKKKKRGRLSENGLVTDANLKSQGTRKKKAKTSDRQLRSHVQPRKIDYAISSAESSEEDSGTTKKRSILRLYGSDENLIVIDTKRIGNIGRYFNHSCMPNVFPQSVFIDTHDLRFPWVAFFTKSNVQAGSELTWDYRYETGSLKDKFVLCNCQTPLCRGRLL